jgi:hypothetical protein
MASTLSSSTRNRTVELCCETILGQRRHSKNIRLALPADVDGRLPGNDSLPGNRHHLLVAINRTIDLDRSLHPDVHRAAHHDDMFEFSFPQWMDAQRDPRGWQSQSASGALYLSRTDLMPVFGIAGVVLLQVLQGRESGPCLTSRHKHHRTREVFEPLDSETVSEIRRDTGHWQRLDTRCEIPPGEVHQLRNVRPRPSVVLIQMYGDCRIAQSESGPRLDMSDHIYQPE